MKINKHLSKQKSKEEKLRSYMEWLRINGSFEEYSRAIKKISGSTKTREEFIKNI